MGSNKAGTALLGAKKPKKKLNGELSDSQIFIIGLV